MSAKTAAVDPVHVDPKPDSSKSPQRYREERVLVPESVKILCQIRRDLSEHHIVNSAHKPDEFQFFMIDFASFGIRVFAPKAADPLFRMNESVQIEITHNNNRIYKGKAKITNEKVSSDGVAYGLSLREGYIDKNVVKALISDTSTMPGSLNPFSPHELVSRVRPDFKILIADLNTFLQDIRNRLSEEDQFLEKTATSESHLKRLREQAVSMAIAVYSQDLNQIFQNFQNLIDQFTDEEHEIHRRYFRTNFYHVIHGTPFMKRAFEKPLGYAGDYGLMVMFYEYEDIGASLFDKFMHRFSCGQPAAVANKNRVHFISDHLLKTSPNLKTQGVKIGNIACGPARELQIFLEDAVLNPKTPVEMNIVDQESQALDHAIHRLKSVGNTKCDFHLNVFREDAVLGIIKKRPFSLQLEGSDFIISAGLFDYLSDRVSLKLIERFYEMLKPGGEILIGNVSDQNPDRFTMDYFMDWKLILRSPEQLRNLVPPEIRQIKGVEVEVMSESLGINLFLRIKKPRS